MTDKSVYGGLFQDPPYISTDPEPEKTDPYDKQDGIPSRYLEQSVDVIAANEKRMRKHPPNSSPTNISDVKFRYTSYTKKSTGPGSYYGCIQSTPYEHLTEPWDDGRKKKKATKGVTTTLDDKYKHLPNIKTNPAKKGTYGYPGLLLSKEIYIDSSEEESHPSKKKGIASQVTTLQPIGPVFRVQGVSHAYFDELPNTGASAVYAGYEPPIASQKNRAAERQTAAQVKPVVNKPFNWSAHKANPEGCINPFPNTWIDPAAHETPKQGKHVKHPQEVQLQRVKGAPEWKPNSFGKTSIISSCLRRFY